MARQTLLAFLSIRKSVASPLLDDKAPHPVKAKTPRERVAVPIASVEIAPLTPPPSQTSTTRFLTPDFGMDSAFVLPDSTDWIATSLPAFEPLEAALRCEVCKEFYENPVITSCSHTFCSLCIRRCITSDGKCPTCRTANQADKLLPNKAVREIVNRYKDARPKALELARADTEDSSQADSGKKRKLDETDLEEGGPGRQTRSRTTRTRGRRANGVAGSPIEIPDSEGEGDEDFVPEGMVKCPVCRKPMKEEQVFLHLDTCSGEEEPSSRRSTRSKTNNTLSTFQRPPKDDSPAPTRLPGLTYHLMNETKLRKKLQELGLPTWGNKGLMMRRHTEWLHLWNSNCDASESRRKSKRELLKELDTWERTQGGNASAKESEFMRKDFDGRGHANTHRSQFDDLIANARQKRQTPKTEDTKPENQTSGERQSAEIPAKQTPNGPFVAEQHPPVDPARPYENNEDALASIREKIEAANHYSEPSLPLLRRESSKVSGSTHTDEVGIQNPFGSPSRKVPMFAVPESPVLDVENATGSI